MKGKVSVSQLAAYIKGVFDDELILHGIEVYGEIFEYSVKGSVTYITLREEDSYLHCVRYAATERLDVGSRVLLFGSVSFYAKTGRVSFVFKSLRPYGEGEQYAKLLRLKETLKAEGLFENRPIPAAYIASAALITSEAGAVIHDFTGILMRSGCACEISVYPVRVQGEGSENSIADAIGEICSENQKPEVIVIARGGGSGADLLAFNTERVARAVASSCIPVISAVGHETDYTLCDFCSGVRAGTPSIAAEYIVRRNEAYISALAQRLSAISASLGKKYSRLVSRLRGAVYSVTEEAGAKYYRTVSAIAAVDLSIFGSLNSKLLTGNEKLSEAIDGISRKACDKIVSAEARLSRLCAVNEQLNPLKVLSKGYAGIYKDGAQLKSVSQIEIGDELKICLADGIIDAAVKGKRGADRR